MGFLQHKMAMLFPTEQPSQRAHKEKEHFETESLQKRSAASVKFVLFVLHHIFSFSKANGIIRNALIEMEGAFGRGDVRKLRHWPPPVGGLVLVDEAQFCQWKKSLFP